MEHTTQRRAIDGRSRVDFEPDNSTRAVVHHDEDPMGLEAKRLTPKEIDTPQTVLRLSQKGQPRGSVVTLRTVVGGEDSSDNIFIESEGKRFG